MWKPLVILLLFASVNAIDTEDSGEELFEGRRLKWEEDDGLKIEIVHPIKAADCKMKARPGDWIEQFYRLDDKDGKEIGSNFGDKP
jgi:hypothetical protein